MFDKDGKPLLSWRVLLLPYIEQDELFRQFHLDEPWDSPHNIALLDRMPRTYEPFRGRKDNPPHTTYYRVFAGTNTPFGERVKLTEIPNGTSNTIMVIEAGEPVPYEGRVSYEQDEVRILTTADCLPTVWHALSLRRAC